MGSRQRYPTEYGGSPPSSNCSSSDSLPNTMTYPCYAYGGCEPPPEIESEAYLGTSGAEMLREQEFARTALKAEENARKNRQSMDSEYATTLRGFMTGGPNTEYQSAFCTNGGTQPPQYVPQPIPLTPQEQTNNEGQPPVAVSPEDPSATEGQEGQRSEDVAPVSQVPVQPPSAPGLYEIKLGLTDYWVKIKRELPEDGKIILNFGHPEFGLAAKLVATASPKPKDKSKYGNRSRGTERPNQHCVQNMIIDECGTCGANVYFPLFTQKMKNSMMLVTFRNQEGARPFAMCQIPFGNILETQEVDGKRTVEGFVEIIMLDTRICIGILNYYIQFDKMPFGGLNSPVNVSLAESGERDPVGATLEPSVPQGGQPQTNANIIAGEEGEGTGNTGIPLDIQNPALQQEIQDLEKSVDTYKTTVTEFETKLSENDEELTRLRAEIEALKAEVVELRAKGEVKADESTPA